MQLDFALLADYAYTDNHQKFFILGEFRYVHAPSVPYTHHRMVLAARILADATEVRDQQAQVQMELTDSDGNPVVPRSPEVALRFVPVGSARPAMWMALLTAEISGLQLPRWGDYSIHIFTNGIRLGDVSFTLNQIPTRQA